MSQAVSALAIRRCHILEMRFSCRGSECEPYGSEEFFVVKRFGQEGRRSCVQSGGTNQRIVLSRKDDDARRRRNFAELRLNFQAAHLGHTNIDQRNRWAMSLRIAQELPGVVKCFCVQISRQEKTAQSLKHRGIIVEQANNKGIGDSQGLTLQQPL
jgi:hypothetical protein